MATSISERAITLTTDNLQAEILLVDGAFRVRARGPTPLTTTTAPGLYAMKVKVGDEESEELLAIEPDATPYEKFVAAPSFESPIPLARTSTTHEYHQHVASRLLESSGAGVTLGQGSAVMICVRDPSQTNFAAAQPVASDADRAAYEASFQGFRLLDRRGESIVDLDAMGEHNMADGYMALTVKLDPDWYALAYRSGSTWICTALPTAPGRTLQVYVSVVPTGRGAFTLTPDLPGMAVIYDELDKGFDPGRRDWEVGETVRRGLIEGRNYVDTPTMQQLLTEKFTNPVLGLYGVHLLLVEPKQDLALIKEVVENLRTLLGENHPDVVAVTTAYERLASLDKEQGYAERLAKRIRSMTGPPLLARSWDLLVDAAGRDEGLLASAPTVFQVARDLVRSGIFLAWQRRTLGPDVEGPPAPTLPDVTIPQIVLSPPLEILTRRLPTSAGGIGNIAATIGMAVGPLISAGAKIVQFLRHMHRKPEDVDLAAQIAAVDSNEKAAAALVALARRYDWPKLLPQLRKDSEMVSRLSGMQRDLVVLLHDASSDPLALEGINASFVEQLLRTHRVPLSTLVEALSPLELGGWVSTGLREWAARSKVAAPAIEETKVR